LPFRSFYDTVPTQIPTRNGTDVWQQACDEIHICVPGSVAAMRAETLPAQINVWTSLGPEGGSIGAMAVDPNNPNTAYAARGEYGGGLFKTTDGGSTWNAINWGLLTGTSGGGVFVFTAGAAE
jgi:hypothetical protein